MANKEHLEILKQGVTVWNEWREKNENVRPDLSEANLSGKFLSGANLSEANLSKAVLSGVVLSEADLSYANLSGINLCYTNLSEANLSGADLSGVDLSGVDFSETNFSGADFSEINLSGTNLSGTNLSKANLSKANLSKANLSKANLSEINLSEINLSKANLSEADLSEADLSEADLSEANLSEANLSGTNLSNTNFQNSITDGHTLIVNCKINKKTDFRGVGLDNARIDSGSKELLKLNIRRLNWEDWYNEHKIARLPVKLFWSFSNYGSSTLSLLLWFLFFALVFSCIHFCHPEMVEGLEAQTVPYSKPFLALRSLYFSVVTMTTLGFGDMSAGKSSCWGHISLMIQVLLGYVLLGALITRLSILFTSEGPAGEYYKESLLDKLKEWKREKKQEEKRIGQTVFNPRKKDFLKK